MASSQPFPSAPPRPQPGLSPNPSPNPSSVADAVQNLQIGRAPRPSIAPRAAAAPFSSPASRPGPPPPAAALSRPGPPPYTSGPPTTSASITSNGPHAFGIGTPRFPPPLPAAQQPPPVGVPAAIRAPPQAQLSRPFPGSPPSVAPPSSQPFMGPPPSSQPFMGPPPSSQPFMGPPYSRPFAGPPPSQPFAGPQSSQTFAGPPSSQPFGGPPSSRPFGGPPSSQPFMGRTTPFPGTPTSSSPLGTPSWQSQTQLGAPPMLGTMQAPPRMFGMPPHTPGQPMAPVPPVTGHSPLAGHQVSTPSKIDPNQIPRPVPNTSVVLFETRQGNQANIPPPATSDFIVKDNGNCSPRLMRCTMNQIPCTGDLLSTSSMPLALMVQPFALPHPSEEPIQYALLVGKKEIKNWWIRGNARRPRNPCPIH